jgi:hypothetical protein
MDMDMDMTKLTFVSRNFADASRKKRVIKLLTGALFELYNGNLTTDYFVYS